MAESSVSRPVIAGLAVGITFIILFVIVGDNVDGSGVQISDGHNQAMPENFKIVYSYGIGLDYTFSTDGTATGSFTAENCDPATPTQHATLALSQQELEYMWKAIEENSFFSLNDLTEKCPPPATSCVEKIPATRAELQITAGDETNKVEFNENYALNHNTTELKRFNAIVSTIAEVLTHHENQPKSDCAYD